MVAAFWRQLTSAARSAAARQRGWISRQLITRNRRVALGLAVVVVAIGIGAIRISGQWLSPGVMILPILAGGLLLWPRALRILFVFVAGIAADLLETRYRQLAQAAIWGLLVASAAWNVWELARAGRG